MKDGYERISGYEDTLDSRDIEDRIVFLTDVNEELLKDIDPEELEELRDLQNEANGDPIDDEELLELLRVKADVIDMFGEDAWGWGVQFLNEDYFEEYAEEFFNEIGALDDKMGILTRHIDWEGVADEMKQDYEEINIFNDTFWCRE